MNIFGERERPETFDMAREDGGNGGWGKYDYLKDFFASSSSGIVDMADEKLRRCWIIGVYEGCGKY